MNEFFHSLKSDLLDKRFLPILAVLGVALIAAIAYAVLGGGSSSPTSSTSSPRVASTGVSKVSAVAITQAPAISTTQAAAETTSGASKQHSSSSRDPFKPLPGVKSASAAAGPTAASKASSSSGSAASSTTSGSSTSSAGGSAPATPAPKPTTPAKPRYYVHFHVTAQFGVVPAPVEGAPAQPAQLQTFPNIALNESLPSKDNPQLVYLGVLLSTGKEAAFSLTGEAILHGSATCKPSPTQCQAIVLQAGQSETLEVVSATGQPVTYELKLVSIAKSVSTASAAKAHAASKAAAKLDRNGALQHAGLHFSLERGGLVFIGRPAFGAHSAHAARRR
jgi:hypothetical protein